MTSITSLFVFVVFVTFDHVSSKTYAGAKGNSDLLSEDVSMLLREIEEIDDKLLQHAEQDIQDKTNSDRNLYPEEERMVSRQATKLTESISQLEQDIQQLKEDVIAIGRDLSSAELVMTENMLKFEEVLETTFQAFEKNQSVVAFTATDPQTLTLQENTTIVFASTTLSEGDGYNPNNGIFTAPVGGLYEFSVQSCNVNSGRASLAIVNEGMDVALGTWVLAEGSSCHTLNAVLFLDEGKRVWIRSTANGGIKEDSYREGMFMGVLIE